MSETLARIRAKQAALAGMQGGQPGIDHDPDTAARLAAIEQRKAVLQDEMSRSGSEWGDDYAHQQPAPARQAPMQAGLPGDHARTGDAPTDPLAVSHRRPADTFAGRDADVAGAVRNRHGEERARLARIARTRTLGCGARSGRDGARSRRDRDRRGAARKGRAQHSDE